MCACAHRAVAALPAHEGRELTEVHLAVAVDVHLREGVVQLGPCQDAIQLRRLRARRGTRVLISLWDSLMFGRGYPKTPRQVSSSGLSSPDQT